MVNVGQQIGGSVGTALLSSLAAAATTSFITTHPQSPHLVTHAAAHGYTTAFWWSAAIFTIGAITCGLLIPARRTTVTTDKARAPELVLAQ